MTEAIPGEASRRQMVTSPLLVRREKYAPVQAVVCQVGTKEGEQEVAGNGDVGRA